MKIFICLLATVCACSATFLNLLGNKEGGSSGNSHITYNAIPTAYYDHGSAQIIKVILEQRHSGAHASSGGYSHASGHHYGHGGETQIFKVITQRSASPAPVHVEHGFSASASYGSSFGSSYAPGYSHGSSYSSSSQLNGILPHILPFILQDYPGDSTYSGLGGGKLNSQLVAHFGQKGHVVITPSIGKANSFYSGGHIVEKGVLKLRRVEEAPHSPPVHRPPQHDHGW